MLVRAASFGRKGLVRRTYSVCGFEKQSIRGRLDFETCFTRQVLEIPTDWPKKVCEKNCPISGNTCSKVRWGLWKSGFGWLSGAPWFRRSGSEDLINEEWFRTSGTRRARGQCWDTHTADNKVRTHGQTLLFDRYRFLERKEGGHFVWIFCLCLAIL